MHRAKSAERPTKRMPRYFRDRLFCCCWLVAGCWLLVVGCWLLVLLWLLVVGCWLLVVGSWLLAVGGCLLVVGCWLLVLLWLLVLTVFLWISLFLFVCVCACVVVCSGVTLRTLNCDRAGEGIRPRCHFEHQEKVVFGVQQNQILLSGQ